MDGGSTFSHIHSFLSGEFVVDYACSEQRVAFLTSAGRLFHSRPQSIQIVEFEGTTPLLRNTSKLMFDSTGELNAIHIGTENQTIIISTAISLVSHGKVAT